MDYGHYGSPEELPPDVQAALDAARAAYERAHEIEIGQRQVMLDYAWLLCACRRWPDPAHRDMPPQAGCPVHGHVMVTLDGRVL